MNLNTSRILDNLNPPQREAVETIDGPLLILAGAGSGKTRVVTRRIANILAHGARPWEVLAITFTNKAAGEMQRRVEDLVGQSGAWISTFHSFCSRVLRRECEALGYPRDFTIYDEEDSMAVVKDILKETGADQDDKRFSARAIRSEISGFKNKAFSPEEVPDGMFHERMLKQIYTKYQETLKKNAAFDFDDLLGQVVTLFRSRQDILERYQQRFRYVLVDEYQDTNACQYHLVKLLGSGHRNVCATGDPDQSIYGWRGADVRNILSFERDFPDAKIVKLEQNYRSTKTILKAADAVIANNAERKPKTLWTENDAGVPITLIDTPDEQMESGAVAREIAEHVRRGKQYSELAVFYRTNAQSRALEKALREAFIPYQLIGGTAFYERREVKDAMSYLRLVVNPKDDAAFRRIINVPRRALGDSAVEKVEIEANRRQCSLLETLDGTDTDAFLSANFKGKAKSGLIQFSRAMDKLRAMPVFPVANVVKAALELTGLRSALVEAGEDERVGNVDELVNAAVEFDRKYEAHAEAAPPVDELPPEPGAFDGLEEFEAGRASIAGFLENAALVAPTDALDSGKGSVTMMTLHMAKGLEYPIVFLTGLEEGLLPMVRTSAFGPNAFEYAEDPKAIEEERRLMYVGITRAMEKLYITKTRYRMRYGRTDMSAPSRFLAEIPEKLLEISGSGAPSWDSSLRAPEDEDEEADPDAGNDTGRAPWEEAPPKNKRTPEQDPFAEFEREVATTFGDEKTPPANPSPFVKPARRIDPAVKEYVDRIFAEEEAQDDPHSFEPGDRVNHELFGEGTVDTVSGSGLAMKLRINFRRGGPKLLLYSLAQAKMRKL